MITWTKFSKLILKKTWNKKKIKPKNIFLNNFLLKTNSLSKVLILIKKTRNFSEDIKINNINKPKLNGNFFYKIIILYIQKYFQSVLKDYNKKKFGYYLQFFFFFFFKIYKFLEIFIFLIEPRYLPSLIYLKKLIGWTQNKNIIQQLTKRLFFYFLKIKTNCNLSYKFYLNISNKFIISLFLSEVIRGFIRRKIKYILKFKFLGGIKILEFFELKKNCFKLLTCYQNSSRYKFKNRILIKLIVDCIY
nr:hypothetical protein CcurKRNrm2_p130 [Cryptomonas curvata]